jgi:hypothetical protein
MHLKSGASTSIAVQRLLHETIRNGVLVKKGVFERGLPNGFGLRGSRVDARCLPS